MKYISTRGLQEISFTEALLMGLASDGGLLVPQHFPYFNSEVIEGFKGLNYSDLAFEIMRHFIDEDDIPAEELRVLLQHVYSEDHFSDPAITPLKHLYDHYYLLGLSYGPTLAFKDLAMQFLGAAFEYVLDKQARSVNIVGATSGDTGSAAEYAMIGKKNVNVFMLSPYQRMSPFQQAQMYSINKPNIFNIAVRGVFDDCQDLVKELNADTEFKEKYHLSAVNSINWARILAQIVYYFKGWLALDLPSGTVVDFCVPSGNFGNVLSGYYAKKMGLPIRHLIVATNENDILAQFFNDGIYHVRSSEDIVSTSTPSMDIGKASNFERYLFDVSDQNRDVMQSFIQAVSQGTAFDTTELDGLKERVLSSGFLAGRANHEDRIQMIRELYQDHQILVDPHTANGIFVARSLAAQRGDDVPVICLETALPVKFADTMREAIGIEIEKSESQQALEAAKQHFTVLDKSVGDLKTFIQLALG